jgi:hypothetical protein
MTAFKNIMAILIALMASIMIFLKWPDGDATGWMVALIGWLEVINYQRKEEN